jgi:hypothetical protein
MSKRSRSVDVLARGQQSARKRTEPADDQVVSPAQVPRRRTMAVELEEFAPSMPLLNTAACGRGFCIAVGGKRGEGGGSAQLTRLDCRQ